MNASTLAWLRVASAVTLLIGLVAALASHPATAGAWQGLFDLVQWPVDGRPGDFDLVARQLSAVLGGVMVGWGVTLLALTFGPLQAAPRATLRAMLTGLGAWFVVDSTGSMISGLPGNVLLNVGFLALFLGPLLQMLRSTPDTQ
ncbi:MAG: hypothetical protein KTR31_26335 [Myxococcales bacterium]|nr:hypothetical protein [Myxococcales bacterium]